MIIDNIKLPQSDLKATVTFQTRVDAEDFARDWTRHTLTGHTIGGNSVTVHDVTEEYKVWIDSYVKNRNDLNDIINNDTLDLLS